jgi:hypothetical protein
MHTERQVSDPLPRLTAQRREWLTESSTCRYEDLQILLANYDAVPGLLESHARLLDAIYHLRLCRSCSEGSLEGCEDGRAVLDAVAAAEKLVGE